MNQKTNTYLAIAVAILAIALIIATLLGTRNRKNYNSEKLISEKLQSEKSAADKQIADLNGEYTKLRQKSDSTARLLNATESKLSDNQKRINALSGENRRLREDNKIALDDLEKSKVALQAENVLLKSERDKLQVQSDNLQASLNSAEKEKTNLEKELGNARMYNADNFLATATRGKTTEKVVICHSRAKKLKVSFDVPQSLTEKISFKIITPAGTAITPTDQGMSWLVVPDSRDFTASLTAVPAYIEKPRQVVLSYTATEKLMKGEYKIQIFSDGTNIGNCRLVLK